MWVAKNKDNKLLMFFDKPVRNTGWKDINCTEPLENWCRDISLFPPVHYGSYDALYNPHYQITYLDENLFPELTWEDEPLEIELISKKELEYLKYKASQAPSSPYMGEKL